MSNLLVAGSVLEREARLEQRAIEDGIARYRSLAADATRRGEGAKLAPCERLLAHWHHVLTAVIADECRGCARGEPGLNRSLFGPVLRTLKPEVTAMITMQACVNRLLQTPDGLTTTRMSNEIGRAVLAEVEVKMLHRQNKDLYREMQRKFRKVPDKFARRWWKRHSGQPHAPMKVQLALGAMLLQKLVQIATVTDYEDEVFEPAFKEELRCRKPPRQYGVVRFTEAAMKIMEDGHRARQYLRPRYLPMVVPPMHWSATEAGGYVRIRTPLIMSPSREVKRAIAKADMPDFYAGLNAVGSTPWRINTFVLEVQRDIWNAGGGELGIPPADDLERPAKPDDDATEEEIKAWKREAVKTHRENISRFSQRCEWLRRLGTADEFSHEDEFYFPHAACFRGRVYPIPQHLHHHANDVARGLLEAGNAVPLEGAEATRALWIHAANCYGKDKLTNPERLEWVAAHRGEIVRCAADPRDTEWWREAEEPWQFLAAIRAMVDSEAGAHAWVAADGTCNGTQHLVALGRDEDGAEHVNMRAGRDPGDLYTAVLKVARAKVLVDASAGNVDAVRVLPLLERKVIKQTVMTVVYGVTYIGARRQLEARLRERGLEGRDLYAAATYLTKVVLESVIDLSQRAAAVMAWLQECAGLIADAGRVTDWVSPVGLPVIQTYRKPGPSRLTTHLRSMQLRINHEGLPVWRAKQIAGVAPNYIHSIDSSHWMMVAVQARNERIDMAGVHDSYWCHAANYARVGQILREKFVDIHSRPLLKQLLWHWTTKHPDIEFPEPPEQGSLDITEVLRSEYFFN